MKLMQWMHILRRQSGVHTDDGTPSTPVAARRTDAAAILRLVSNALQDLGPDRTVRDMTDPRPEDLLEQVEGSGYDLGLPHVQHTAGQMRVLLAAARADQVDIDRTTVDSMRQAIRYLGQHLMKGKRFPRQPDALVQWNRRFQAVMATAAPADIFAPPSQPAVEEPLPVMALPQEHPALVVPNRMDPDSAIDAAVAAARELYPIEKAPAEAEVPEVEEDKPLDDLNMAIVDEPMIREESEPVVSAPIEPIAMVEVAAVPQTKPQHMVPDGPMRLPSRRITRGEREALRMAGTFRMPPRTKPLSEDIEFDVEELERLMRSRRRPTSLRR